MAEQEDAAGHDDGEQLQLGFSIAEALASYEDSETENESLKSVTSLTGEPSDARLTQVRLENFKGFQEIEVALDDINLLVGTNNSGKSTILQAIKLGDSLLRQHYTHRIRPYSARGGPSRQAFCQLLSLGTSGTRIAGAQVTRPCPQRSL